MSRLDDLSNKAPTVSDAKWNPEKLAFDPDYQEPKKPPAAPNAFTEVTILQLYVFLWKMLAASLLFAAPYLLFLFFNK
jgi:hypothetical protein